MVVKRIRVVTYLSMIHGDAVCSRDAWERGISTHGLRPGGDHSETPGDSDGTPRTGN